MYYRQPRQPENNLLITVLTRVISPLYHTLRTREVWRQSHLVLEYIFLLRIFWYVISNLPSAR